MLVEQRTDSDCLRCCVATILRVPYEQVPQQLEQREGQWNALVHFLAGFNIIPTTIGLWGADRPMLKFGGQEIEYQLGSMLFGHWLASVRSPRNDDDHTVVMRGAKIAWDPHPRRDMGHRGFTQAMLFTTKALA